MTILKDIDLASIANSQQQTIDIVAIHGLNHGPIQSCDWRPWTDPSLPEGIRNARVFSFGYNAEVLGHSAGRLQNGPTVSHASRHHPLSHKDRAEKLASSRRTISSCGACSRHITLPSLCQKDKSIESLDKLAEQVLLDLDAFETSAPGFDELKVHGKLGNVPKSLRSILFVASSLGGAIAQQALCLASSRSRSNLAQRTLGLIVLDDPGCSFGNLAGASGHFAGEAHMQSSDFGDWAAELSLQSSRCFQYIGWKYQVVKICHESSSSCSGTAENESCLWSELAHNQRTLSAFTHFKWPETTHVQKRPRQEVSVISSFVKRADMIWSFNPINPKNPQTVGLTRLSDQRLQKSCEWVFERPECHSWLHQMGSNVLWVSGRAGAGKSVLAATIVQHLQQQNFLTASYFFSERRKETDPNIDFLWTLRNIVARFVRPASSGHLDLSQPRKLSVPDFAHSFSGILDLLGQCDNAILVIDALDELEGPFAAAVEQAILRTQRRQTNHAYPRILVTSRKNCSSSRPCASIDLDTSFQLDFDLSRRLLLHRYHPTASIEESSWPSFGGEAELNRWGYLELTLSMELWYQQHSRTQRSTPTPHPSRSAHDLHSSILNSLLPHDAGDVQTIFAWILTAVRPLDTLELHELLETGTPSIEGLKEFTLMLKNKCRGLVTVTQDGIVQFTHSHTAETFQTTKTGINENPAMARAHEIVANTCLKILVKEAQNMSQKPSPNTNTATVRDYAERHWSYHVSQSLQHGSKLAGPISSSLSYLSHSWLCAHQHSDQPSADRMAQQILCVGALYGLQPLISISLAMGADPGAGLCDQCPTPLYLAILGGDSNVIKLLLSLANSSTLPQAANYVSALCGAIQQGFEDAAACLIESGATVNGFSDEQGWSPLHFALALNQYEIAEVLLDHGADPYLRTGNSGETALHLAAARGHEEVIRKLLQSQHNDTLCERSSKQCIIPQRCDSWKHDHKRDMVSCDLIDHYCQHQDAAIEHLINIKSGAGATALHLAASNGHTVTVGLLLEAGCDVQIRDADGHTPLSLAEDNGHSSVVTLLLRYGAVLRSYITKAWTTSRVSDLETCEENQSPSPARAPRLNLRVPPALTRKTSRQASGALHHGSQQDCFSGLMQMKYLPLRC